MASSSTAGRLLNAAGSNCIRMARCLVAALASAITTVVSPSATAMVIGGQYMSMRRRYMTKAEVLRDFRELIGDSLRGDVPAKREAWNNYTDSLRTDGLISEKQYNTWDNPF